MRDTMQDKVIRGLLTVACILLGVGVAAWVADALRSFSNVL